MASVLPDNAEENSSLWKMIVKVMGPIPHDSAPNPLTMFLVAIW
jgi:hypothetical protein